MDIKRAHSGSPYERRYGFSRAVAIDGRVLVSGTAPVPSEGEPVAATAFDQMNRCVEIDQRAMADLDVGEVTVVRTRMFITDPSDADEIGRAHAGGFGEDAPTATMIVVASLLDPVWKIELEVEAVVNRR